MTKKIFSLLKIFTYILWVPFIITISFEMITFSDWIYEFNWERNNISYKSNLRVDQLNSVSDQIKDYFKDDQEKIGISLQDPGKTAFNLFNQKEIDHMVDVKNLVKTTLLFEKISLFFIFFSIVIISYKNGFKKLFNFIFNIVYKSLLLWSGIFLIILLGIIINFNATFILFHKIFFRNDLWILDPRTDYLLIMFPERFFLEVCLAILIVFVIINLLFFMTSWLLDKKLNPR
ncbi:MAG: TIGR01906 family membrane protein [Chloroflexota bacterium]|nr:TIGR01906 family membrane protein [Chloroflexota bacterium]